MDPMEFRLRNAVQEGERMPNGVLYPRIACTEIMEAMKNHPHYTASLGGPNRGRGVSVAARAIGGEGATPHVATISVNANGTIALMTGSNDLSGTRTSVAMQAAEVLGLEATDVVSTVGDTDSAGWSGVANGSKITYSTGLAAIAAAEEVKLQMKARAALVWEVQLEDVEFQNGTFRVHQESGRPDELPGVGGQAHAHGRPDHVRRVFVPDRSRRRAVWRQPGGRGGGPRDGKGGVSCGLPPS